MYDNIKPSLREDLILYAVTPEFAIPLGMVWVQMADEKQSEPTSFGRIGE
jgi:hypothetical protein